MRNDGNETSDADSTRQCGWCGAPSTTWYSTSPTRFRVTFGSGTPQGFRVAYCYECWKRHVDYLNQNGRPAQNDSDTHEERPPCGWCGDPVAIRDPSGTALEVVFEDFAESTVGRFDSQYCRFCRDRHEEQAREFADGGEADVTIMEVDT